MRLVALFVLAISIAACDTSLKTNIAGLGPGQGAGSDSCGVQSVSVTPDSITLRVGQTLQANASIKSCATSVAEGVRWASSDTNVATVDPVVGFIQARRVGAAIITASAVADVSVRGTMTVNVSP